MKKVMVAVAVLFVMMALYSFAKQSDQLDTLTTQERAEVVSRWQTAR